MMNSDEDDLVYFGTAIEREEDTISRKKKSIAEASSNLRTLAPWKQEVRDEEGRRRFHGAFSGGFYAGHYNIVGSKEGWTPQTFTASRKNRAEIKQQDLSNFLDDDEKAELEGNSLGTSMQFDTFGFTVAEVARKQSEKEQNMRCSNSLLVAEVRGYVVRSPCNICQNMREWWLGREMIEEENELRMVCLDDGWMMR